MRTSSKIGGKALQSAGNGSNGHSASASIDQRVHQFQPGLGDHPLWQAFMDELKAQREADIAESNRLADLELAELEQH